MPAGRDGIVWEDPPRRVNQASPEVFDGVLDQVKARPGEWARIRSYDSQSPAYSGRKRLHSARHRHDEKWEFKVARIDGDGYGLYARYRTEEQMGGAS